MLHFQAIFVSCMVKTQPSAAGSSKHCGASSTWLWFVYCCVVQGMCFGSRRRGDVLLSGTLKVTWPHESKHRLVTMTTCIISIPFVLIIDLMWFLLKIEILVVIGSDGFVLSGWEPWKRENHIHRRARQLSHTDHRTDGSYATDEATLGQSRGWFRFTSATLIQPQFPWLQLFTDILLKIIPLFERQSFYYFYV